MYTVSQKLKEEGTIFKYAEMINGKRYKFRLLYEDDMESIEIYENDEIIFSQIDCEPNQIGIIVDKIYDRLKQGLSVEAYKPKYLTWQKFRRNDWRANIFLKGRSYFFRIKQYKPLKYSLRIIGFGVNGKFQYTSLDDAMMNADKYIEVVKEVYGK